MPAEIQFLISSTCFFLGHICSSNSDAAFCLRCIVVVVIIIIILSHQHKAAGRKTRLDIQNYGCNGNLLCDHGVVETQSNGKALSLLLLLFGTLSNSTLR